MRLNPKAYDAMVREASPRSPLLKDCIWAFCVGGSICLLGEILNTLYCRAGFTLSDAAALTSAIPATTPSQISLGCPSTL